MKIHIVYIVLFVLSSHTTFAFSPFKRDSLTNNCNYIKLPILNVGFSGQIGLTGKYFLSIKPIEKFYINCYYGIHSLDYIGLTYTIQNKWYGGGFEYFYSRYKNTFFSLSTDFYKKSSTDRRAFPNEQIYIMMPMLGILGINKDIGLNYHIKIGWGSYVKSLDMRSKTSNFYNYPLIDLGIGLSIGLKYNKR